MKCGITKKAFTLAEVLITLGIIGIVAEMTIPTLMNSVGDQVNKVGYKKAYSVASQAWLMAYNDGNVTNCTDWFDGTCNKANFNEFKKQVKISKDCGNDTASCWNMSGEKSWTNQWPSTSANSFIDPSGFAWTQLRNSSDTTPEILVDTNGDKKPNKYGKDRAIFRLWYDPNTSAPKVYIIQDCPGVATTEMDINNQNLVCPSNATSPCWYTSWITGAK